MATFKYLIKILTEHPDCKRFQAIQSYHFHAGVCTQTLFRVPEHYTHLLSIHATGAMIGGVEFDHYHLMRDQQRFEALFGKELRHLVSDNITPYRECLGVNRFVVTPSYRNFTTVKGCMKACYEFMMKRQVHHSLVVMSRIEAFLYINWFRQFGFRPVLIYHLKQDHRIKRHYDRNPELVVLFDCSAQNIYQRLAIVEEDDIFHDAEIKELIERFSIIKDKHIRHQVLSLLKELSKDELYPLLEEYA